jgi:hypothetical protein
MLHHLANTPGPEKLELLKLLKNKKKYAPKLINNNNEPPIFLAVKSGNTEMALKLFEDYPENQINATNQNEGNTLLIEASKVRMIPLLKLLHDMLKVDFEIKNKEGKKASDYVELTTEYLVPTAATTLELASNPIYEKNVAVTDQVKAMFFDIMNFSMCPVCLVIVVSDEGCTYVNHKCAKELRHEALYQKYKDKTEEITWCKLCGGIAVSHGDGVLLRTHQHVSYIPIDQLATTPVTLKPMPTTFYHHDMSISDAICLAGRGRGFPEKYGRIFTYYNELCKLEEQLKQGQKLTRKRVYTKLIETVWASSETENLIPNTYEIIKRFSPRLVEYRKAHKEDLQKINDTMPVGTKEEKKAKDDVIFARSSKQTNLMIDAAEEDVDPVFKEFNVVLLCNLRSGQTVNNDNQSMSNIAASQSMSNIAASQSSSNVATTDNTNRDVVFLEERNKLYNKLDEKIKALADSDPNFVYKRHESEIGEEKDSYQNSSIKKDENNECFQELGPHSDNRPTYKFTHYQVGTSNPKKYVEHSGAVCAAHLRSALDTNSAVSNVKPFPLDRLVNQLAPDERYIGVTCTLSIGAETCLGHIFPDQLNQIPDREFFLPVDLETEVFDEETLIRKGKEFKKQYNIDFMKNHITSDYDIMYATKTSMTGGAEDFISDISELVHRGEALCALHAPQQKAGIRIKTYRRKAALRHGTRRV